MTLSTRGHRGRLAKSISVFSDDPKTPRFTLKIDGKVEVLLAFKPERIYLSRVAKNTTIKRLVRLAGKLADKAKLSDPKPSSTILNAKITHDDSGRPALAVQVKPGAKEQRFSASVKVKTGLKAPSELSLFVWGVVAPDVFAERSYIFFPAFEAGKKPPVMSTTLESLSGRRFRVRKVVDSAGAVRAKAVRAKRGWTLTLTLTRQPKSTRGKLQIYLDRPDQKVLDLNYGVRHAFAINRKGTLRPAGRKGVRMQRMHRVATEHVRKKAAAPKK